MFNWLKTKNAHQTIKKSSALYPDVTLQRLIKKIQSLSGVTQGDFQSLYVKTIDHFIDYISMPNEPLNTQTAVEALNRVILALKKRQGYLLPLGADSEIAFRQREEWTFAVFVAALGDSIDVIVRSAVIKALLPHQAYAWLHRNTQLFLLWERYLKSNVTNNVFAELIKNIHEAPQIEASKREIEVKQKLNSATETQQNENLQQPLAIKQDDVSHAIESTPVDLNVESHVTSNSNMTEIKEIKEIDLTALSNSTSKASKTDNAENNVTTVPESKIMNQPNIPNFKADDFWHWLKRNIHKKKVTWNKTTSFIHGADLGILIQIPEAINAFLNTKEEKHDTVPNELILQQRPDLTKQIKKHEQLIKNTRGSRIHVYCVGKWEDRQTVSGIVIAQECLTTDDQPIPINTQLTPDPLDSV
ncbi:MAG: TraI domain-containing protein [Legionellales bacterium]|nr:TraI domain-containing protein [Legionellales bacterium]